MSKMINWSSREADPIKDLERQFLCGEWKPDPRDEALHERLSQYYCEADTNRNAWSEFREWCRVMGYTVAEINAAKRNHRHDNN